MTASECNFYKHKIIIEKQMTVAFPRFYWTAEGLKSTDERTVAKDLAAMDTRLSKIYV